MSELTTEKPRTVDLKFHADPGHAWLEVNYEDLKTLGLEKRITRYSYQLLEKVFLEEDVDAPLFIAELKKRGYDVKIVDEVTSSDSIIRHYPSYRP